MARNDGGPAFPTDFVVPLPGGGNPTTHVRSAGMSLRDYFAAAALTEFVSASAFLDGTLSSVADEQGRSLCDVAALLAFNLADAMLAEREKGADDAD